MTWSTAEIEDLVSRPRLGVALVQLLVRRSMDFGARIESFSIDNIGRRLVRSLIRFPSVSAVNPKTGPPT